MLGETISHYRIVEKLGEGGMGEVYLAEDIRLGHRVAIKRLPHQLAGNLKARQRFEREARAVAQLQHPYVIALHEFDEIEGEFYLITEYASEGSLRQRISSGMIPLSSALRWSVQAAEALAAAHARGILHRDIKPDNLLLTESGDLKISDFGLARFGDETRLTLEGSMLGTLAYMAPEQIEGREADERSDLFALGSTLYEMFTGRQAFAGDTRAGLAQAILNSEPEAPATRRPELPAELSELLQQLLQKDPSARPVDCGAIARRLREIATAANPTQELPAPAAVARAGVPRARWLAIGALVVVAALLWVRFGKPPGEPADRLEDDVVAIMHFDNVSDPEDAPRSGEMISRLLITAMSEKPPLRVISRQRLLDVVDATGNDTPITVARTTRARWMIVGAILREQPSFVINADLIDVRSGELTASKRIDGAAGEDLFAVVDRLADQLLQHFMVASAHRSVSEIATSSLEAYRHYVEGMEFARAKDTSAATRSFRAAVREDSTFAMAYLALAGSYSTLQQAERRDAIENALRYAERVSPRERYLIRGAHAELSGAIDDATREYEALIREYPDEKEGHRKLAQIHWDRREFRPAVDHFRAVTNLDPLDALAHNMLAYGYKMLGDPDSSLLAINRYIELEPELPDPYDTRGELYAMAGQFEKAMDSFRAALERRPDYGNSLAWLAGLHLRRREYGQAELLFRRVLESETPIRRSLGRLDLAFVPLHRGRMTESIDLLDRAIVADELEESMTAHYRWKRYLRCRAQAQMGAFEEAVSGMRELIEIMRKADPESEGWTAERVEILMLAGQEAEAQRELEDLRARLMQRDEELPNFFQFAVVRTLWQQGDAQAALSALPVETPAREGLGETFLRGVVHLEAGRLAQAVEILEAITTRFHANDLFFPFEWILVRYHLGLAYERSGWLDKAAEQYREFLLDLEGADPVFPEVDDAKRRLVKLSGK